MSFKTITAILLVICLGATASALGVPEEPPQDGLGAVPPPLLTITDVRWLLTGTLPTIQICTADDLPAGLPTLLLFITGTMDSVTVEGAIIDPGTPSKCVTFSEVPYKYTDVPLRYELLLEDASVPPSFLGRGVSTFAITVKTTQLTCDSSIITKITWSGVETMPADFCIDGSEDLDKACYHDGNLTTTEFCFGVNDGINDVNVCLNGPLDVPSSPADALPKTNYFYYGSESIDNLPADATLSLAVDTLVGSHLRAIVRLAEDPNIPQSVGIAKIHDCPSSNCIITAYPRKFAKYEVCVEAINDILGTSKTGTTTFTDLNLNAFDGGSQKSPLLELVFANGLEPMKYLAILNEEAPSATFGDTREISRANLDCTSVAFGHACFGFLDTKDATDTVYMTLSAMDDPSNTIVVPYQNT